MYGRKSHTTYGVVAEFTTPETLLAAAKTVRKAGYRRMDAYTPFPVHGLADAIGFNDQKVPWVVFLGGITGAVAGISLQYYVSVVDYPLNVGGKPLFSLPMFVPISFECTILLASFAAFFGMLGMNMLPQPYHSIFNAKNFERASQDRFFLCVEADDELFDKEKTLEFFEGLKAEAVSVVEE